MLLLYDIMYLFVIGWFVLPENAPVFKKVFKKMKIKVIKTTKTRCVWSMEPEEPRTKTRELQDFQVQEREGGRGGAK